VDESLNDGFLEKAPKVLDQIYRDDLHHKHQDIGVNSLLFNKDLTIVKE
jgi:hypothetical protein